MAAPEVVVEQHPLVVDDHALVTLAQTRDRLDLLLHRPLAPEQPEVLVHRDRELGADAPTDVRATSCAAIAARIRRGRRRSRGRRAASESIKS
jgi:hypothetical protein